ncbi:hypothetical protein LGN30_32050 [Burkholderia seminalis]|uniref:hypothetical protein n=1 Tax=Burkholderia seminalis TaxID=488731 RepID=UPI001CF5934E|nr:hypothetical protein [Burkholderia seminalis]MCA8427822.1 hypothetical protein [Burkholderia seminalis]
MTTDNSRADALTDEQRANVNVALNYLNGCGGFEPEVRLLRAMLAEFPLTASPCEVKIYKHDWKLSETHRDGNSPWICATCGITDSLSEDSPSVEQHEAAPAAPKNSLTIVDSVPALLKCTRCGAPARWTNQEIQRQAEPPAADERAAFEHHERASNLQRDNEGDYMNPCVQSAWEGWQARAARIPVNARTLELANRLREHHKLDMIDFDLYLEAAFELEQYARASSPNAAGAEDLNERAMLAAGQWAASDTPIKEALVYRDGFVAGARAPRTDVAGAFEDLHTFLDAAAGDGFAFDGVDAADLYIKLFPAQYAAATESDNTPLGSDGMIPRDWRVLRSGEAAAAPADAQAAAPVTIPAGWKLVPIEPTREMLDAHFSHLDVEAEDVYPHQYELAKGAYAAMLGAAPPPPAPASAPVGLTELEYEKVRLGLTSAKHFIANGVELGFIRMPDVDCPDPAHNTPKLVDEALTILGAKHE